MNTIIMHAIITYILSGIVLTILNKKRMEELENNLQENGFRHRIADIYIRIYAPNKWIAAIYICLALILWPITIICSVLKSEWNYSKIMEEFSEKESA